jgi:hypothetical protein
VVERRRLGARMLAQPVANWASSGAVFHATMRSFAALKGTGWELAYRHCRCRILRQGSHPRKKRADGKLRAMPAANATELRSPREAVLAAGSIFTVGHSTRDIESFISLLRVYGVEQLVDIRTVPRSRHNPQFNADVLGRALGGGIGYVGCTALGGLRHPQRDSPNAGWRNRSFQGYADYMQTAAFRDALNSLIELSRAKSTAIMCAEAVPWRCHRSLVADALLVHGIPVVDILSESSFRPHKLTPFAQVQGVHITYPGEQGKLF